ncbi:hypothetical protein QP028_10000 [Corynebacterium suedekumii]|nr:hypothetical protein QP028_10000 [Corynebacterium suedekumii]
MNELTGQLVTPVGAAPARITVDGGIITSVTEDPTAWEPAGLTLVPGFVDLHNHGGHRGSSPTAPPTTAAAPPGSTAGTAPPPCSPASSPPPSRP